MGSRMIDDSNGRPSRSSERKPSTKDRKKKNVELCSLCKDAPATVMCVDCGNEKYCFELGCDEDVHRSKRKQNHRRILLEAPEEAAKEEKEEINRKDKTDQVGVEEGKKDVKDESSGEKKIEGSEGSSSAKNLSKEKTTNESQEGKSQEGKSQEGKSQEGKPKEGKPKEGKPKEGKPKEDKPKEDKPKEDKPKEDKTKEEKTKVKVCGNGCKDHPALISCVECNDVYCKYCDISMHRGKRRLHNREYLPNHGTGRLANSKKCSNDCGAV